MGPTTREGSGIGSGCYECSLLFGPYDPSDPMVLEVSMENRSLYKGKNQDLLGGLLKAIKIQNW